MDHNQFDGEMGPTGPASSATEPGDVVSFGTAKPPHDRMRLAGRVGRAIPGAVAGALLIGAIAFGASSVHRPASTDTSNSQAAGAEAGAGASGAGDAVGSVSGGGLFQGGPDDRLGDGNGDGAGAGDGSGTGAGVEPTSEPTSEPTHGTGDGTGDGPGTGSGTGSGTEPTSEPTSEPTPKPNHESMNLVLTVTDGGNVKVDWTRCYADGAVAYKVVRSTDGHVTWPYSGADHQLALIMDLGTTAFVDTDTPAGKTLVYRVFCVGGQDGAWTFVDSTPGREVHVPGPDPTPNPEPTATPQTMSIDVSAGDAGGVWISWSGCDSDGGYKVVRSSDESTTWPLGEHDTLVASISDPGTTHFTDLAVEAGGHYFYRVFCVAPSGDGYKVVNSTHVADFTVPAP